VLAELITREPPPIATKGQGRIDAYLLQVTG
jgi:hypothetical protein